MHLLTSLRKLAVGGRSVITTIHQPSSRLYQQLDKLLLLSQGCAAVQHFEALGSNVACNAHAASCDSIRQLSSRHHMCCISP